MSLPKGYDYRPMPDYLEIKKSDIEGVGVFAKDTIDALVPMGRTHIHDPREPNELARVGYGGFINNSSDPNCVIYKVKDELFGFCLYIRTIRKIEPGEEITVDYNKSLCGISKEI